MLAVRVQFEANFYSTDERSARYKHKMIVGTVSYFYPSMWLGEQQKFDWGNYYSSNASTKVHFYFCSMTNTFCEGLSIETGLQNLQSY